jgi:hypothetical protein
MHKAAVTPENAAMLLIDHQLGTMGWTHSHDINLVETNALKLAKIAKALDPACGVDRKHGGSGARSLVPELEEVLPEVFARRVMSPGPRAAALSFHFSRHR